MLIAVTAVVYNNVARSVCFTKLLKKCLIHLTPLKNFDPRAQIKRLLLDINPDDYFCIGKEIPPYRQRLAAAIRVAIPPYPDFEQSDWGLTQMLKHVKIVRSVIVIAEFVGAMQNRKAAQEI